MAYCRPHQVFLVSLIIIAISRFFDTAQPPPASPNTSNNRDQSRAKAVIDRADFSEGQTATNTLAFGSQPPYFPGNLRACTRYVQPSCTSSEERNDKFNQSQSNMAEGCDFIEDSENSGDSSKKSPISLLNSREAINTSRLLAHFKVSNKTSGNFENKSDAGIGQSIQSFHHPFEASGKIKSALNSYQGIFNSVGSTLSSGSETDSNYIEASTISEDSLMHNYSNYSQVTASNVLGYENDIDLSLFTFTCQGRCGEKISFPCSCSATCLIYDTCCDNMAQDCPHILDEGRVKFDHIRTADITCSKYPIYIIETCPRSVSETDEQEEIDTANVMGKVLGKENTSLRLKNRFLHHIDTTVKTEALNDFNSTDSVRSDKNPKGSITERLIAALSNAPVTDSVTGLTFINKAIYDCHNMPESTALPWAIKLNYTFLSFTKLEDFHFMQEFNEYQPDFNTNTFKAHLCRQDMKKNIWTLQGRSRSTPGLADDGLEPQCPAAITGMAQFVVCSLKNEVESLGTADFNAPSVSIIFDSRFNRNLYLVKLRMALPKSSTYILSVSEKDTIQNIIHVARLAKAFRDYRMSRSLCSEKEKATRKTDMTIICSSSLANYVGAYNNLNLPEHIMEKIRGPPVVDQNGTTTVCVAPANSQSEINPNTLRCMDDYLHERDLIWLSEFRSSPCFRHLENLESLSSNKASTIMESHGGWLKWLILLDSIPGALILIYS
ncbi:hypothetical protein PoB_007252900 [Plakobranchus ocellatus]|uniref:SMB domain-containing protein n=1 Tax=Plakobranchus ocellatus TaxID=259542 RepID=A0AAV4DPD7_9GAST|nr:hypothetical protein PoB_007252900 [Plakobranchus ocellatus]